MSTFSASTDLMLRAEVEELVTRYATAIDARDWGLFRTLFIDNAHIDYGPLMGVWDDADIFTAFMRDIHAPAGRSLHRMTNIRVSVVDETIVSKTYGDSIILDAADESKGDHGAASYDDMIVRTSAGLKISSRKTSIVLYEKFSGNLAA